MAEQDSQPTPVNVVINIVGGLSSSSSEAHPPSVQVAEEATTKTISVTSSDVVSALGGSGERASLKDQAPRTDASPSNPSNRLREAKDISTEGFTAQWQDEPEAHFYWLEVATDPDFAHFVEGYRPKKVLGNSTEITGLDADQKYYYRIRPEYESGPGDHHLAEVVTATRELPTAHHVVKFPEEGGFIDLGDVEAMARKVPEAMTIEAWIKPEVVSDFSGFISAAEDTDAVHKGWFLGTKDKKVTFGLSTQAGSLDPKVGTFTFLSAAKELKAGHWHHVAATYDGDVMRLLIDGELQGESDAQSGAINYPHGEDLSSDTQGSLTEHQWARMILGAFSQGQNTLRFQGKMTEVRLWKEARPQAEIQSTMYYRLTSEQYASLVGYWRLDQGVGPQIHDHAGHLAGEMAEHTQWTDGDTLRLYRPFSQATKIVSGLGFHLALRADGTVWSWGSNQLGRLGDGTYAYREAPIPVRDENQYYLQDVIDIAAGAFHALAVKKDGKVLAWGGNDFGQLGDGSLHDHPRAARVVRLNEIVAVACGDHHSLALKKDGSVWAWGWNTYGQLGLGHTEDQTIAAPVKGVSGNLVGIRSVTAGHGHSLALSLAGEVYLWGSLDKSRPQPLPIEVKDEHDRTLPKIKAITSQRHHVLALTPQGQVLAWGKNDQGQLGLGHYRKTLSPTLVKNASGSPFGIVNQLSAGHFHNLAVKKNRTLWAWGGNTFSQLGDEAEPSCHTPVQIRDALPHTSVISAGYQTSVITDGEGRPIEWGANDGHLISISVQRYHALVLKRNRKVLAFGQNNHGQLGLGSTDHQNHPIEVLADVKQISTGSNHSLVVKQDGSLWAWGYNGDGALGNQTTQGSLIPFPVKHDFAEVIGVGAGEAHSVALDGDGHLWAWGYNGDGRCGDGSWTNPRTLPIRTKNLEHIIQVVAGWYHTVALREDGTVWTFGNNGTGALGDGTTSHRHTPVQVKGPGGAGYLKDVIAIFAGHHTTFAVNRAGHVYSWGYNNYGQLGNNSTRNTSVPVRVKGPNNQGYLKNVTKIAAGTHHALALALNGTVWAWGYNGYGQLGNNTRSTSYCPVQVKYRDSQSRLSGAVDLAAGDNASLALQDNGQLWTWGRGALGLLANGSFSDVARTLPGKATDA